MTKHRRINPITTPNAIPTGVTRSQVKQCSTELHRGVEKETIVWSDELGSDSSWIIGRVEKDFVVD